MKSFLKTYWMWMLLPVVLMLVGLIILYLIGNTGDDGPRFDYELI